jgi:hypothetical protein
VHEPQCQLVNHVALVQLDSVDTEPMDACNALTAPSEGVRRGHVNGVGVAQSHGLHDAGCSPLPLSEVDITGCNESRPRTEAGERQLTPLRQRSPRPSRRLSNRYPKGKAPSSGDGRQHRRAVVEVVLVDLGWSLLYHDERPSSGSHGVDLVMLTPSMDKVAAMEVKATLQPGHWPRLVPVRMNQMTIQWLDKRGNAGMIATELHAADVYGFIAMVQFARRQLKAAVTEDLSHTRRSIASNSSRTSHSL